jgi:proteasome assembly chaperone (PAC2) family protein
MADALVEHAHIGLEKPVLIAAFRGWNDAGDAASFAARHLGRVWKAERVASIDPEEFYDFQAVRPHVRLLDGETREITWPTNEFFAAKLEGVSNDALILVGTEPNVRWRSFSRVVLEVARRYEVGLVITLGALLADVPHSRPVPVTGTAVDPGLVRRLGLNRSRYEGPTGIVGVLHTAFADTGVDSASLWAAVPHYLAVSPNPKAALALVEKATELIGASADTDDLERAADAYEQEVSDMVATDDDVQGYVRLLEERMDENARTEIDPAEIPSGDDLAAELERFLQERGSED